MSARRDHLEDCEERFDAKPGLLGTELKSPNYHTCVPDGEWVHPVLPNFDYAVLLLRSQEPWAIERASSILSLLLELQETDPCHPAYGIWPWLWEEPIEKMSPPDWNWADFCGARLAMILQESASVLPNALRKQIEQALRAAAQSIFRRNVQPDYTNIAIMGAVVCAASGEILEENWLLEYGRRRLAACVAHAEYHGGFNEFNSPTYTAVVVQECERLFQLVRDAESRRYGEWLWRHAWRIIADHFHLSTGQWAGPHGRAYSDLLSDTTRAFLAERTGAKLEYEKLEAFTGFSIVKPRSCPDELREAFGSPGACAVEKIHQFLRKEDERLSRYGKTWMSREVCLGSFNRGDFWTQCRPVLGYWVTEDGAPVVIRLRLIKDGRDFSSGLVRSQQQEAKVLSAVTFATDRGAWHPRLDRPSDGVFPIRDMRVRYEIQGPGVSSKPHDQQKFEVSCGKWTAWIHPAHCTFEGREVLWELNLLNGGYAVDLVLYRGKERAFSAAALTDIRIGVGMELLRSDELPSPQPPVWSDGDDNASCRLDWGELSLLTPTQPEISMA
jgi:hypothetical protein